MAVVCGSEHVLTLDDNNNVWIFSKTAYYNQSLEREFTSVPVRVEGLPNIVQIAVGSAFSVCLDVNGKLWTFGLNYTGQLGHKEKKNRRIPAKIKTLKNIIAVSCGSEFSMCLRSDHTVYGFGSNSWGQLGNGSTEKSFLPRKVQIAVDIKQVACGTFHTVFLTFDGEIYVCGNNSHHKQLGLGESDMCAAIIHQAIPIKHPYLTDIISVACGSYHTIVMDSMRQLFSFGAGAEGQLCLPDRENRNKPELVAFTDEIISFTCGHSFTLILDSLNRVWVFGIFPLEGDGLDEYFDAKILKDIPEVLSISSGGHQVIMKCKSAETEETGEIWGFATERDHQNLSLTPKTETEGRYRTNFCTKPQRIPLEFHHIIGQLGTNKSRAKSARK